MAKRSAALCVCLSAVLVVCLLEGLMFIRPPLLQSPPLFSNITHLCPPTRRPAVPHRCSQDSLHVYNICSMQHNVFALKQNSCGAVWRLVLSTYVKWQERSPAVLSRLNVCPLLCSKRQMWQNYSSPLTTFSLSGERGPIMDKSF